MTYSQIRDRLANESRRDCLQHYNDYIKSTPYNFSTHVKLLVKSVPGHVVGSLFEVVDILDLIQETIEDPDQPLLILAQHILSRELGLESVTELQDDCRITMARTRIAACVTQTDEPIQHRVCKSHMCTSRNIQISDIPLIFDTGCSCSITPRKSDFVSKIIPVNNKEMQGIGHKIKIEGKGWVEWDIIDENNMIARVRTQAYYAPEADDVRLFSPQAYFQENRMRGRDCCWFDGDKVHFTTAQGAELQFPFDSRNNIPYMLATDNAYEAGLTAKQVLNLSKMSDDALRDACRSVIQDNNLNLTASQKELLLWHQRLCHLGQGWIQELMKSTVASTGDHDEPVLPTKTKAANCPRPQCASCHMAKQHVCTPNSATTHVNKDMEGAIRSATHLKDDTFSMDQIVCKLPGRLSHTFGKE